MAPDFDERYWDEHWQQAPRTESGAGSAVPPNPYVVRETSSLAPGTALDAGCGEGDEAIWLASRGWQVTAADISADALARAASRGMEDGMPRDIRWLQVDLTGWDPGTLFDLVTTHYAHPSMPQLAFYERLSGWVEIGGTLLIVGHLHSAGHGHEQPAEVSVTRTDITARLDPSRWEIVTAEEHVRTVTAPGGQVVPLHDVVVRATRLPVSRRGRAGPG